MGVKRQLKGWCEGAEGEMWVETWSLWASWSPGPLPHKPQEARNHRKIVFQRQELFPHSEASQAGWGEHGAWRSHTES